MPIVTFYQLDDAQQNDDNVVLDACAQLSLSAYQRRKWAVILCQDKQQAEALDEHIWSAPVDRFIPHNLVGEGPKQGTPIEITWPQQKLKSCHTIINVAQSMVENFKQYQHIIDFVPLHEEQKQAARERYKQYKQSGCTMQFEPLSQLNESN